MTGYEKLAQHDIEIDGSLVHYVDVGEGPAVVMVHGSPVSSFEFRHQISALASRFRVVAPDLLGFGGSAKPATGASFPRQSAVLRGLLDELDLTRFRLVVHDWGGPIGVAAAARHPEQVSQLVLLNTTLLADFQPPPYWRPFVAPWLGELLLVRLNAFGRGLPLLLQAARSADVRRVYAAAFETLGTRRTVLRLERLEGFRSLMEQVADALPRMQVPTMILWGLPDPYFRRRELERLERLFTNVEVHEVPGGGHFLAEDANEAVTRALHNFLE